MQFMDEQPLSLLLVGHSNASQQTKTSIRKILISTLGLSEASVTRMLGEERALVCRSIDRHTAESVQLALNSAGATVEIIEEARVSEIKDETNEWFSPSLGEVKSFVKSYVDGLNTVMKSISIEAIKGLVDAILEARARDQQIFILGNGGSASLASHLATDLIKDRFNDPRYLFRVTSLTDNASVLTATANDFGYEAIFVNQLKPWLREDDLVIAISSSGNSPNIVKAIEYAAENGARTIGIIGFDGGATAKLVDNLVHIPCKKGQYGFAEDATSLLVHMVTVMIYEHDKANVTAEHFLRS